MRAVDARMGRAVLEQRGLDERSVGPTYRTAVARVRRLGRVGAHLSG